MTCITINPVAVRIVSPVSSIGNISIFNLHIEHDTVYCHIVVAGSTINEQGIKEEAIRSLWRLENPGVKGLLRRVIGKIFNETQIKGWCNEFEARNAPGREAGTAASA